jgi:hypothetical protein
MAASYPYRWARSAPTISVLSEGEPAGGGGAGHLDLVVEDLPAEFVEVGGHGSQGVGLPVGQRPAGGAELARVDVSPARGRGLGVLWGRAVKVRRRHAWRSRTRSELELPLHNRGARRAQTGRSGRCNSRAIKNSLAGDL